MRELPNSFKVVLRIHVHDDNLNSLERLVEEIARAFPGDERYQLDFQHLRNMGGEGGKSIKRPMTIRELTGHEQRLRRIAASASREVLGLPQPPPNTEAPMPTSEPAFRAESASSTSAGPGGEPYICYASRPNSLLVRSNGRLGKCTVALDDVRNDIGYIGDDGTIVVNNEKLTPWIRGLESLELMEAGCPMQKMPKLELPSPYPDGRTAIPIKVVPAKKVLEAEGRLAETAAL